MTYLPGLETEHRRRDLSAWFTPPELARRIVDWAIDFRTHRPLYVLEPSCGYGALVMALLARNCKVVGIDIDPKNVARCEHNLEGRFHQADFLQIPGGSSLVSSEPFDLAVMNPPFENGAAEAHIMHALSWARRVVCHCPLTTLEGIKRKAALWDKVQLHRMVIHSARPKYGEKGGATAMCTVDVTLGHTGAPTQIEWW